MSKAFTSIFLGIYFFIFTIPQYVENIYYVYDRVTIQFFLLSVINLIVFMSLLKTTSIENIKSIFYKNSHVLSFVLFLFFAGLSIFIAINKIESIVVLANFITLFISFILILRLSQNEKINFLKLFIFFSVIGIILETARTNLTIYDNVINNGNFLIRTLDYRGFTGNPNISAFSIAIKLPVIIFLIYTLKDVFKKFMLYAIITSSILSVLLFIFPIHLVFIFLKNLLYDAGIIKPKSVSAKVISVGNISLGGTGKTPTTIAIANFLEKRGFSVGIVSRGHGRENLSNSFLVHNHSWRECGDEVILLKNNVSSKTHIFVSKDMNICPVLRYPKEHFLKF